MGWKGLNYFCSSGCGLSGSHSLFYLWVFLFFFLRGKKKKESSFLLDDFDLSGGKKKQSWRD